DWAGRWALVALRPGELPAQAQPTTFIAAVAAFEQVAGGATAAPAWRSALRRWPGEPAPYLALGNLAYASGKLPVALDYYRRGLHASPGDPALGNNLASVLGELGCPRTAAALLKPIQAGLAASSHWHPPITATLAELAPQAQDGGAWCAALYSG
ncbi:MAG: hypothetical protein KA137_07175, partial [Halioglobus sp.]|nr:hypothetical protein [Halioglobus sp.]